MLKRRFQKWNRWRRQNCNSKFYQFLVLIGIRLSPSFAHLEENEALCEAMRKGFEEGLKRPFTVTFKDDSIF